MKGIHLIADLIEVPCADSVYCDEWLDLLKRLVIANGLKIINSHSHIFKPPDLPGFTCYVLIDVSHFAVHTYAIDKKIALDLFSCGEINIKLIFKEICDIFDIKSNNIKSLHIFDRF